MSPRPPSPRRAAPLVLLSIAACADAAPPLPRPAAPPPPIVAIATITPTPPAPPPAPFVTAEPAPLSTAEPAPPPPPPAPRLTSLTHLTRIFARPKVEDRYLGYIAFGGSLALRATDTVPGEGCTGGFYQVEPRGFVCKNALVTLAPTARQAELIAAIAPSTGALPFRYAYSDGAPHYNKLPSLADSKRLEQGYGPAGDRRTRVDSIAPYDDLATLDPIASTGPMPSFLANGGGVAAGPIGTYLGQIPPGNMLSFTRAFPAEGRVFLLTTEQVLVPADRVRLFRPSGYHGLHLGADARLPRAFLRIGERPRYRVIAGGTFEKTGALWPIHGEVAVTGAALERGKSRYWETVEREAGGGPLYVSESDAAIIEAETALPLGIGPGETWIAISLNKGTLVAYEGLTPVYATLISPGAGGAPSAGAKKNLGTTPLGTFRITFKHVTAMMTHELGAHPEHYISDVPHIQYFNPPYALHAAYWHDRFGEPTSAGCINLSPLDAEILFGWSDPPVPASWQGVMGVGAPEVGKVTTVVIRR